MKYSSKTTWGKRLLLAFAGMSLLLTAQSALAGGWYVANTASTEWVRYKRVYLTSGTYRFTARAGASTAGSSLHVEVDDAAVQMGLTVPNTGRADSFTYVHLGRKVISQGYHDLKVVFDSSNVSLDWFMLSKDSDATTSVKTSDITMLRPDTTGMLIAPVVAFGHQSGSTGGAASMCNYSSDEEFQPYSDEQIKAWYGIPMYRDFDRRTDRYWDNIVDDLLASRAQVPLIHCRETKDFTRDLQDRSYLRGPGHFEGRYVMKFAEAVQRNPQAASALKVGMFWENGGIAALFNTRYGYYPGWGDPALVDYVMTYHLSPWFDSIPGSMLYQPTPGKVIISAFANHPENMVKDGKMADFFAAVRSRLQLKYGYDPLFVLPAGGDVDNSTMAQGWGQCPWGLWDGPLNTTTVFKGTTWATTCAGSRRRLDTVWLNDWDPVTGTGTPASESPGVDNFRSHLDSNGNSVLLASFAELTGMGTKLVQQEGFTNMAEGNALYRSYHPGWTFPNQHLAAMREYADPTTRTLIFEAEGCDDYSKVVNDGNSGGSYRMEWYTGGDNLDVYRPLHNLQTNWKAKNAGPGNLVQVSAGFYDVWAVAADGKVWAQPITGATNAWTQVTNAPAGTTSLSISKDRVWAISGTRLYSANFGPEWPFASCSGWTLQSGTMVQLSTNTSQVWAVNASGQVFYRSIHASTGWTLVPGSMDKVFAGDAFVWGIQGGNIYYTRSSPVSWTQVTNPNNLTQLAVGSEEVWGSNASGQVYRRNHSGIGGWDLVSSPGVPLTHLTIGENYVWGLAGGTPYNRKLEGFAGAVVLPPLINNVAAGDGQVTLTWTAVTSATGYNLKRATTSGGPYTTIQSNMLPFTTSWNYTDASAANGATYYYVLSALTPSGETANSAEVSASPQSVVPGSPSGLTAELGFGSPITVQWNDNSINEAGFKIERLMGSGSYVQISVVGANVTSFVDTTNLMGPSYSYRVRAYNAAGESGYSNSDTVLTSMYKISRSGWIASASTSAGGAASNALDNNMSSRWSTGGAQFNGQWFQVDMGTVNTISQVDLATGGGDYPKNYQLYFSLDGVNWGASVTSGLGMSGTTCLCFTPQRARFFRAVQTGTASYWWSINEVNAYGLPGEELSHAGWLFSAAVSSAFACNAGDGNMSTRWTSGTSLAAGQYFQADMGTEQTFSQIILDQGTSTNDFPKGYQVLVSNDGVSWSNPVAVGAGSPGKTVISFAPQTARYVRVVRTGALGSYWSIHEFRVYGVPTPLQLVDRTGWTLSASVSGGANVPAKAKDGDIATSWNTGTGQVNGQWFQIDMGQVNSVGQIILEHGALSNDYPRNYQVYVSQDGLLWGNSVATGQGTQSTTTINLQPQTVRYMRITLTGSSGNWWSINEVNACGAPMQALDRAGWVASASDASVTAPNTLDGSSGTLWSSGTAQSAGQWFQIDMGSIHSFSQIVLNAGSSTYNYPRGYEIYVSNDGVNWGTAKAAGVCTATISTIPFPQQLGRYLRIVQTGSSSNFWSIHELNLFDTPVSSPSAPTGLTATGGDSLVNLSWNGASNVTAYTIKRSSSSDGPFTVIASDVVGTSFTDTGLSNGTTYYYTVSAANNSGTSADSSMASDAAAPLPSPWQTSDIGSVGVSGNAYYLSPTYTLVGSGADIWGTADAFRYVYQTASGDCSVIARVTSQQNTNSWAKAGVMLRETTASGSINAALMVSNGAVNFQWRSVTGGTSYTVGGGRFTFPNIWVQLVRSGNTVSAFVSADGVNWTQVGTGQTLNMAASATMGLGVTSHANTTTSTATFDGVIATP